MQQPGPRRRGRARLAIFALLGVLLGLLPAAPAHAAGTVTVTSPNGGGGQTIVAGTTQKITWSTSGVTGNVRIDLIKADNVATPNATIRSSTSASTGSFSWAVPLTVATGTDFKIRVTSLADPSAEDLSNADFEIEMPTATLTAPNGGETVAVGSKQNITWSLKVPGSVKLDLLKGGVLDRVIRPSVPAASGKFTWDVPVNLATGSNYRVRVSALANSAVADTSNGDFTVGVPTTAVTEPNTAVSWALGSKHDIKWSLPIPGNVKIDLLQNDALHSTIRPSVRAAAGTFNWAIPLTLATGSNYKIRVSSVTNGALGDASDVAFTLTAPTLTVTSPNGGESWVGGAKNTVTWTPGGTTGSVKVELLANGVASTIRASVPAAAGKFDWLAPITVSTSTNYRVRVTSLSNPLIGDTSNADFEIAPPVAGVVAPNGGESWQAGSTQRITWNLAAPGNVRIELLSGGTVVSVIRTAIPAAAGGFNWSIPLSLSAGAYRVRISSLVNPDVVDSSNATFNITLPGLSVTAPTGNPSWAAGSKQTITWTSVTGNVRIQLIDGVTVHSTIAASAPGAKGSYTWSMPVGIATGSAYAVRVTSLLNSSVTAESTDFTVVLPAFSVTAPTVASIDWLAGSKQTITWTPISGNVKIELDTGGVLSMIRPSTLGTAGKFTWTIPIGIATGSNFRVRVTSLANESITDISDNTFEITGPTITVTAPAGGENWARGSTQTVTWTSTVIGNVRVELVQGATVTPIRSSVIASAGRFSWRIPSTLAPGAYTVRVTSIGRPTTTDSSASFNITA